MKTIYSLLYGILVLFNACGQSEVQEKFDTITTYSYTNSYGKDGRLAEVLIKQQSQFLEYGTYISGRAVEIIQKYNYPDNETYVITETNDLSPNETSTIIRGKTFEKYYTLKNNDTINFSMRTYTDATKSKPLLEKENYTLSRFPITEYEENINIELNYYYDEKGDLIKIIKRDFNSGEVVETYGLKEIIADTTIIYYRMNTDTSYSVKRYIDNGKAIEITFDENQKPQNKITNYTANGFDIKVRESVKNGIITVDSIYQIKGKKVRSVSISPEDKSVTTLKYDGKGNITKEICKSKSDITISNEELNKMIRRYKESKKQEN